jgi:hypothetical protein
MIATSKTTRSNIEAINERWDRYLDQLHNSAELRKTLDREKADNIQRGHIKHSQTMKKRQLTNG